MSRFLATVIALVILLSACASEDSSAKTEMGSGYIFFDSTGSRICESILESHPPQCGDPSVKLHDLAPGSVVALMPSTDPASDPVSWTEYWTTVEGTPSNDGLTDVLIADPIYLSRSDRLVLRVADLGITTDEPVTWPFDLTNATDTDVALTFTDGQRIELTLSDDSGEVYRWSDGMFFVQAIAEVGLPAGATFPYVVTADPIDLSPGAYTAEAWVTAEEANDVVVTWTVTVETGS
jgi:hypothetical protein